MSILIKGMEMPTNCADCTLNYDQMACGVTGTRWWSDSMVMMNFDSDKERLPNCPLIEIPTPHGRLGDLDALVKTLEQNRLCYVSDIDDESFELGTNRAIDVVRNADTIIEAED